MATYIKILNNNDTKVFASPPQFNGVERKQFFSLPNWVSHLVLSFRTPTNQIGFVLQLGYFKAVGRFFAAWKFHQKDIDFIVRRLDFQSNTIDFSKYTRTTFERHQQLILLNVGIQKFDLKAKALLMGEAQNLCFKQIKPRLMFMSLVNFLRAQKIEIPSYHTFEAII